MGSPDRTCGRPRRATPTRSGFFHRL